jgi:plastocyanin
LTPLGAADIPTAMSTVSSFASRLFRFSSVVILSAAATAACTKTEAPAPAPAQAPSAAPAAAVPAAAANAPGTLGAGKVTGTAKFAGKAPEAKGITTPDPFCAKQNIKDEELVVGAGGALKNVLVRVVKGANGTYPAPAADVTVDQSGCMYRPRVQGIVAGQTVLIKNSDQTLHNVHTYKGASTVFNQAQIPGMAPMPKKFADGGQIIKFKCDVHPWMTGYVAVATNPFFAVSGADGTFTIDKLPPGTYTLEAWHERLGTKTADVTVSDDKPATATFEFAGS